MASKLLPGSNGLTGPIYGGASTPSAPFGIADPTDTKQLAQGITGAAAGLSAQGTGLFTSAQAELQPVLSNLEKQAAGDRAAVLEASAPDVATVSSQYDTAFRTAQTNLARGGGRNAVLADVPFKKAASIQGTLQKARSEAQGKVADITTQLSALGLSAEQGGLAALTGIFGSIESANAQNSASLFGALGDIGSAIGTGLFTVLSHGGAAAAFA